MAAPFDDTKLEQVRQATDIVQLVSAYVPLKRVGSRFRGLCPFHNEKSPSFYVNPAMQIFKCFGCQVGGDVFTFFMKREGVTFPEALRALGERAGIPMDTADRPRRPGEVAKTDLYKANDWAAGLFSRWLAEAPECEPARKYLESRGVNQQSIERFGVGAVPDAWDWLLREASQPVGDGKSVITPQLLAAAGLAAPRTNGNGFYDRFRNRVMFPIRDALNRCIAFGGRTLGGDPAKYINSPESPVFAKGRGLFGLNVAKEAIQKTGRAVVVEGYMDCLMPHQHGVENVVAVLGTALTVDQVRLLKRYAQEIVLVFDSDAAGEKRANEVLDVFLAESVDVKVAHVSEGKDPCDFVLAEGGEAFRKLLDAAVPALQHKFGLVRKRLNAADNLEGRRQAAEELLKTVAAGAKFEAVDPIRRGLILADLAKLTGINVDDLRGRITELRQTVRPSPVYRTYQDPVGDASEAPETSAAPAAPAAPSAPDSRLAAERWVLGILLRRPEYFASVREVMSPDGFRGPVASWLARELFAALDEAESRGQTEFDLAGMLSRLGREPDGDALVSLASDLYALGEMQKNPAATLEDAIVCIRKAEQSRLIAEQLPAIAKQSENPDVPLTENAEWRRMAQRLANRGNNPRARPRTSEGG